MQFLVFFVCLAASVIGGICGIGGGVIIKPVIDAMDIMPVSTISFLSGLTVLCMSVVNVIRQRKARLVDWKLGSLLAAGAIAGGIAGNALFHAIMAATGQEAAAGRIQAIVLGVVTLLTLVYSAWLRQRIPSFSIRHPVLVVVTGFGMGCLSAFLGIGGGPINLAVLFFLFSMDTKKAAANSLYIIMFSQLASLATSFVKGTVPAFEPAYLAVMAAGGILGGLLGSAANRRISAKTTDKLFAGLLVVIILICCYNALRFGSR